MATNKTAPFASTDVPKKIWWSDHKISWLVKCGKCISRLKTPAFWKSNSISLSAVCYFTVKKEANTIQLGLHGLVRRNWIVSIFPFVVQISWNLFYIYLYNVHEWKHKRRRVFVHLSACFISETAEQFLIIFGRNDIHGQAKVSGQFSFVSYPLVVILILSKMWINFTSFTGPVIDSKGSNRVGFFPHLRTETDPVSETLCSFRSYLESGRWTKSENPVSVNIFNIFDITAFNDIQENVISNCAA
jgi:hypothetical protein